MRTLEFCFLTLLILVLSTTAFGQGSANATVGGTVADATGALIPGVTITATNTQTGIVNEVVSNEAGGYQFAVLQTGTYTVSAVLPGFQTQTYTQVALGVGQQVRMNFTLQVGTVATAVEVVVAADTLLAATSSSVGTVLPEYKIKDLPLINRNVLDLVGTQAGVQRGGGADAPSIFAGTRPDNVNTTRDGVSVNDTRHNDSGAFAVVHTSPDLVEEVRVTVAAADAETGRGGAQVQMATRSGTNAYRGSIFWTNRNSATDANTWTNNFSGTAKNYFNRNQYGGRLGGPIVKNKTFFFFLYDAQRFITKDSVVGNVLTAEARLGNFRYFPGVENANASANVPTVDPSGAPVRPAAATGDLQSFSVFGRDPLRPGFDTSGWIQKALARMPLPNEFRTGDGLNTAGIRWTRRRKDLDNTYGSSPNVNRDQINLRFDHNFSAAHKLFVTVTREWVNSDTQIAPWPGGYGGTYDRKPSVYTASFVSTLSPRVVNDFRFGQRRQVLDSLSGFERKDGNGPEGFATLPVQNGIPFIPKTQLFTENFITGGFNGTRGNNAPRWSFADSLSWTQGAHAFKGGFELGITTAKGWTNQQVYPYVELGAGGAPVTGIDGTISGLVANNQTRARQLLTDLNGSVNDVIQAFVLSGPTNPEFLAVNQVGSEIVPNAEQMFLRDWRQNDFSAFFKDDWKIHPDVTLNLGMRYDWYGAGYDNNGLTAAPVGGGNGLFGISGTSWADMWQPGRLNGTLTTLRLVGKNSPNPDQNLWRNDYNNFGPAVGISWSIPWWGAGKTVVRAGYGVNYSGAYDISTLHNGQFSTPGTGLIRTETYGNYLNIAGVSLPIVKTSVPLQPVPLTDRSQSWNAYDSNYVNPYTQTFNVSLQRELTDTFIFEARYVGSKGTKLQNTIAINDVNIFESGVLEAFQSVRAGGESALLNRMLNGINLGGTGAQTVNGTTWTGAMAVRTNTTTRSQIANGDVGAFAAFLNSSAIGTNSPGGLLRNGGFPENLIKVNPQFNNLGLISNPANSTYHSLILVLTKRLSRGFTNQTSYTWSRSLGLSDGEGGAGFRNPRDRSIDKQLLGFHRTHDFRSNGTVELPFGPGRALLANAPGWVSRLVEQWQFSAILSLNSGTPINITSGRTTFTQGGTNTPDIVGEFPKSMGKVVKVANGAVYLEGYTQIPDPGRSAVTTQQSLQGQYSNMAVVDASGALIFVNPQPGTLGNLGLKWIEGPGSIGLDMNLAKTVRISENKDFELRVDAINILNHPNFGNPNLSINSTDFGRITTASGSRSVVFNTRLNF